MMQHVDSALAHELFGHALGHVGGLKEDLGFIHAGKGMLYGVNPIEADGMWAENQHRAAKGLPLRPYYKYPGDYVPPKD